jgi:hypothetical protein
MKIIQSSVRSIYVIIRIYDSNSNLIYCEYSNGYWYRKEFNSNNVLIYFEDNDGLLVV